MAAPFLYRRNARPVLSLTLLDARLEALASYDILDTPPEPEFDDVVQIARLVCDTPTALVSLVGSERQWFKARVGFGACETPLSQSVCVHALVEPDLLVIPDLTADPRTCANTLVTGAPHIRFYAGAPLRTPEGVPIGSLCVIDGVPRPGGLTPAQADALRALSRQVIAIMTMRRAVLDREVAIVAAHSQGMASREEQVRLIDAQEAGGVGTFEVDLASHRVAVSATTCRLFGLPVRPDYPVKELKALVAEPDRGRIMTSDTLADGTAAGAIDYRIHRANDGALRWISRNADFRFDAAGNVVALIGVVRDVTESKLIDLRAKALLDLGDLVREATTVGEIVGFAARTLGTTLDAARAAMTLIDVAGDTFHVEHNWCAPGVASLAGTHHLSMFSATVERLKTGATIINANIPADLWLTADRASYEAIGAKAQIVVPLLDHGRLLAALFVHSAEPRTWSKAEIDFALAVADRTYATIARIRAEEHQSVLNQELSHRLKNTLAMVQAITNQTLRNIAERDIVKALEARIIALSKAHDVLIEQKFVSAPIGSVVTQVLGLHGHEGQFESGGPDITMSPKATLSLSLLLHELATNAIKYGALSVDTGRVALNWRIEASDAQPILVLSWLERDGPPARAPTRKGFGSRLIGMGLVGAGSARLDYGEEGLAAEFSAPLRAIVES